MREENIQLRLLQEVNLTSEDVIWLARAMETAATNSLEVQQGGLTLTVNQAPVAVHQMSSRRYHTKMFSWFGLASSQAMLFPDSRV